MYIPQVASMADRSACSKYFIQRLKKGRVAEWFEQAFHSTLFEHLRADGLIFYCGHEDDWDLLPAKPQFPLKIEAGHPQHKDVKGSDI